MKNFYTWQFPVLLLAYANCQNAAYPDPQMIEWYWIKNKKTGTGTGQNIDFFRVIRHKIRSGRRTSLKKMDAASTLVGTPSVLID
ncbi:MAG: hypothetical protein GC171_16385 [Terrimonas sp.]|nr:hypothetical protein [Terrimonas sp.]